MGLSPGFFNPLGYANLDALLIVGFLIHKVNILLFLVLISAVPESARLSMILVGQRTLQELVSVGKLPPVQLIPEIQCQTCIIVDRLSISMDFIVGLPKTQSGYDSIWVIIDRLSKVAHLILVKTTYKGSMLAELYIARIVCLHGVPKKIVSDRGIQFTSKFWENLQESMDTKLNFSSAYHPQTDGQTERVNQILEDMLRACTLKDNQSWDKCLPYVEFSYNNSYQESIKMAPFEFLYGRKCRTPLFWNELGENQIFGLDIFREAERQVQMARENLKLAQSRRKSYADNRRRELRFQVGDFVYLKVSPMRGLHRFKIRGKLAPRYIGPFKILEQKGEVAYQLELPPQLSDVHDVFHVSQLRKCL
jgi:hypothetical protein